MLFQDRKREKMEYMPRIDINLVCDKYNISDDERDSVIMALRKTIEDNPGCEIDIKSVHLNSGVDIQKTKVIFYSLLYNGDLVCDPVGKDGVIHFYGKNADGSVSRAIWR